MAIDAVGYFHLANTLTALTIPGFIIPVQAIFEAKANAETLKELLG